MFFNNQDIANTGVTEKAVLYSRLRFSWELSEIGAAKPDGARLLREAPAAFGRLCVETTISNLKLVKQSPAAFGRLCVETSYGRKISTESYPAAFGRLCVETSGTSFSASASNAQPPSGGCVLKQAMAGKSVYINFPAAFGRLCVETSQIGNAPPQN